MALRAVATQGQQDDVMAFPLLRVVAPYLSIDELMPPMRLRWSRILGRPLMGLVTERSTVMVYGCAGDVIGPVFIDEVMGRDSIIRYRRYDFDTLRCTWRYNVSALIEVGTRNECWSAQLIDIEYQDIPFEMAWRRRYRQRWPQIAPGVTHPVLRRLHARFCAFHNEWDEHNRDRDEMVFYRRMLDENTDSEADGDSDMSE